jgi:hypothetical protein
MKSLFEVSGFRGQPFGAQGPKMGDIFSDIVTGASSGFQSYEKTQQAEDQAKAAAAQAKAAQAQAQAAQANAAAAGANTIAGIPITYWVIGGLGLAGIALVAVMSMKKA